MAENIPVAQKIVRFTPPPEALVYRPTIEEFKDPLAYINRIRPVASKFGICKIVPPDDWQPPFAVNADKLSFSPRIQKLNELEATTRIKLTFFDKIVKFWYLQGTAIKLPTVENKILDLFTLHKLVDREGGFLRVCERSIWAQITDELGLKDAEGKWHLVKGHYEKLLYPFDIFEANKKPNSVVDNSQHSVEKEEYMDDDQDDSSVNLKDNSFDDTDQIDIVEDSLEIKQELIDHVEQQQELGEPFTLNQESDSLSLLGKLMNAKKLQDDREYRSTGGKRPQIPSRIQPTRSSKRLSDPTSKSSPPKSKELKRLEFIGAGPKMAGFAKNKVENKGKTRGKKVKYVDPLAKYVCVNCTRGDKEASLLLCDGCDDSYHTFCLVPSLNSIPKGDWRCPKCVAVVVDKPTEPYGFAQSKRTFTLQEFGAMADEFKSNYFHKPVHHVETHLVESEFWKLVSSIDHDVTVLYGADLHTMDLGSGFPTVNHSELLPCEREYVQSGWNLNNMPVLQRSVLSHINANISGMKVPWMYVGMCFSTFCWHNEDHWSYSINYLHWGEPKTWYGVPGDKAEDFEATMKEAAPELFDSQPDLLHQLVTIMNPNVFILKGIPVYRTDQHAGEFVITFPRAYHAGFNQGYNFAEAVNFAPADWLEMGRLCVAHYAKCRRFCVFSHDELVCRMALQADQLDLTMAMATFMDVKVMVAEEKKLRKAMLDYGIKKSELCRFELLPDDERQCDFCKTTCFLSAIKCPCSGKRIVCLQHFQELCDCPPANLILRYRYKSHEFIEMLQNLRDKFQPFTAWHLKTKKILDSSRGEKHDISTLTALLQEAIQGQYPSDATFQSLKRALAKAEVIMDLRDKLRVGKYLNQISLECFQEVVDDLKNLPCEIVNANIVLETLEHILKLQQESRILLSEEHPDCKELEKCINTMSFAPIELPEYRKLKQKLEQVHWLDEVKNNDREGTLPTIETIKTMITSGCQLPPHPHTEGVMSRLQERLTKMESWEKKVAVCLEDETKQKLPYLEFLLKEANSIKGYLPSKIAMTELVKEAKEWFAKVHEIKISPFYPYVQTIEKLANEGRPMPVKLDIIKEMEILMNRAKLWLDKAETTFLRKHAHYTLLEALCPRTRVGISTFRSRKRRNKDDFHSSPCNPTLIPVDDPLSPEDLVTNFKNVENNEVELMKVLRKQNLAKRANDTGDATYCICQKEFSEGMLQCELCKDYFHAASCVPIIRVPNRIKQQSSLHQLSNSAIKEKFLCPCCMRSRRPRLDAILPLLVGLQELPLRIPEGEALQILTERTMNWQDKARNALDTEELTAALAKLSVLSKKLNEAAAREKTEKIISTELKKAANNPELHNRVQAISSLSGLPDESNKTQGTTDPNTNQQNEEESPEQSSGSGEMKDAYGNTEHAYSSASKVSENSKGKKHSRKSPLVPRQLEPPVLSLSEEGQRTLEDLMVEGDLLEISVDEASFIWRILQATRPRKDDRLPEFEEDDSSGKACSKQKRRKRRPEEGKELEENKKVKSIKAATKRMPMALDKKEPHMKKSEDGLKTITSEDLSDNDEDCAAKPCRKPTGRELLWVQCDGCNAWYHLHCIDLKKEHLKQDQDFLCPVCKNKKEEKVEVEATKTCEDLIPSREENDLISNAEGPPAGVPCSLITGNAVSSALVPAEPTTVPEQNEEVFPEQSSGATKIKVANEITKHAYSSGKEGEVERRPENGEGIEEKQKMKSIGAATKIMPMALHEKMPNQKEDVPPEQSSGSAKKKFANGNTKPAYTSGKEGEVERRPENREGIEVKQKVKSVEAATKMIPMGLHEMMPNQKEEVSPEQSSVSTKIKAANGNTKHAYSSGKDGEVERRPENREGMEEKQKMKSIGAATKIMPMALHEKMPNILPLYPYIQTYEKLAIESQNLPVRHRKIIEMDDLVNKGKLWLEDAKTTFMRKTGHYTLLEVLCPRTRVGISAFCSRKRCNMDKFHSSPCSPTLIPVDKPLSLEDLWTKFKNLEKNEVELMKDLRKENLAKRANDTGDATCFICQKEFSKGMLLCELCKDYFHASCVPVKRVPNRIMQQSTLYQLSNSIFKEKFLCLCCMRSRRPRLDDILPSLDCLQEIPLRIPEGEALLILTDRTKNWQDKAQKALKKEGMTSALAKLSVLSKELNKAAACGNTEDILSTEMKKASNNPEFHCGGQAISPFSGSTDESSIIPRTSGPNKNQQNEEVSSEQSLGSAKMKDDYGNTEHAYSSASKASGSSKGKKLSRKPALVPRQLEPPVISLSEECQRTLEDLMVEGDLLEISVDEASIIWQIIQAARLTGDDRLPEFEENNSSGKGCSKQRRRKRKPEQVELKENKKVKSIKAATKTMPMDSDGKNPHIEKTEDALKSITSEDLPDNEKICAAKPCRKPTGELLWAQCKRCNAWYHQHCISLRKEQGQDYLCPVCKNYKEENVQEELIASSSIKMETIEEKVSVKKERLRGKVSLKLEVEERPIRSRRRNSKYFNPNYIVWNAIDNRWHIGSMEVKKEEK